MQSESIFIEKENYRLHLKRLWTNEDAPSLFLLHGSMEDGKIFYTESGKGLAPFLVENGFDVFIADLRGKGQSTPLISAENNFSQTTAYLEDIPDFITEIVKIKGASPQHFIAHSWGGVLLLAYLARHEAKELKSLVLFGSKRDVRVQNIYRWFNIDLLWNTIGSFLTQKNGFLPAKRYKIGSADEAKDFFLEVNQWVKSKEWRNLHDGFDYATALKQKNLPPILSITGAKDTHSGHPKDVKRLLVEIGGQENHHFKLIGKKQGYKNDYNHINILTHKEARDDHFLEVLEWLKQYQTTE